MLTLSGQVLSGFVERVGDPVPLVTADGSSHSAEELLVDALDGMVELAGDTASSQLAVAVPAHWTGATLRGLRAAMRAKPRLAPNGVPVRLVSDAVAALTALHANPGLPGRGVVALVDFGGGGTTITLADAASSFEPIATSRLTEFSGDHIDQALLAHVLDGIADAEGVDPAGTAAVGSLTALRDECRRAKEALSEQTDAEVAVELPGHRSTVRVTRAELDALMDAPLAAALVELDDLLLRNRVAADDVSTVAAIGGGARIPLIAQRLSDRAQAPVVITPQPALDAAAGAALFAAYGSESDAATGMAPAVLIPPLIPAEPPASVAPTTPVPTGDAPGSATFRQLAWSQDDDASAEPVPYMGEEYSADTSITRAVAQYVPPTGPIDVDEPRAWQRLPQLVFGVAAVLALVAFGGVAIALTSATGDSTPTPVPMPKTAPATATPLSSSVAPPPPPPATEVPESIVTVTSEPPPPPPQTVTVERTVTTTRTTQPTTTTTTTTTTTSPTTTTPTTTTTTTTTSTTPTMTTSYITVPFVPVPIPIQVPATPTPQYQPPPEYQPVPQYPQQPQFPY
jgi:hypothetical protein